MVAVARLTKEYHYKSVILKQGQVHIKFPHVIYKRKSFDTPYALVVHYFRIKGDYEHKIKVIRSIVKFMEMLQQGKVDFASPVSYFPLYVLESRWLMKYSNNIMVLSKKGKMWLEAMQETLELYGELNEADRPT